MSTKKILVVDDEQSIRDIFQTFLQEMGYNVVTAVDGLDALEKIAIQKFELYIIDIYMPRMGGLELIARLKELQPAAVIIVTTGYSGLDVDFRSIRQSAFMYLAKPIQPDELVRAVEAGFAQSKEILPAKTEVPKEESVEADRRPEVLLLKGFSSEQVMHFKSVGILKEYKAGETIPTDKDDGCTLFIERGVVRVYYNTDLVDIIKEGDIWGEENFVVPTGQFTALRAQSDATIRHFPRKRIIEFFTFQEKGLTERFMLNIVHCMHIKWRRSMVRLALLGRKSDMGEEVFQR